MIGRSDTKDKCNRFLFESYHEKNKGGEGREKVRGLKVVVGGMRPPPTLALSPEPFLMQLTTCKGRLHRRLQSQARCCAQGHHIVDHFVICADGKI